MAALEAARTKLQQERKSAEAVERELALQLETVVAPACDGYREMLREATTLGPKTLSFVHKVLASCEAKDPLTLLKLFAQRNKSTCSLWVDSFELELSRAQPGQWIHRQERPGGLSKVLRIYELTGDGLWWTLTETRVPTQGADETPNQTVWKTRREGVYELPCDFIEPGYVQAQ